MNYKINTISVFERQAKRLIKKFPSLKKEIHSLIEELIENPTKGTLIGNSCYKIRMAIASKGKGKSGGARIITYLMFKNETLYLLSIYDKSELENISDNEITRLTNMIP